MTRFISAPLFTLLLTTAAFAAGPPAEKFAGLTIGQSHKEVAKKVTKRENLVGPGKALFGTDSSLEAKTFRYSGSFNRDRHVENVMLYFSSKGTLAGMDVFIKSRTTFDRYSRDVARQYEKVSDTVFHGKISSGPFAGSPIEVELVKSEAKQAKYRSYTIQLRCPAILKKENVSIKEAEKEAAESGNEKDLPADDDPGSAIRNAL